jgi:hypothetical protein
MGTYTLGGGPERGQLAVGERFVHPLHPAWQARNWPGR